MTTELLILLFLTAFIYGDGGIYTLIKKSFKTAGPYLGGRIERQLDTAAGFQEIATFEINNGGNKLGWSD